MKFFTVFSVKYSLSPIILPVVCSKLAYLIPRNDDHFKSVLKWTVLKISKDRSLSFDEDGAKE